MKAIIFTALIAVCNSASLDRRYLPPPTAKAAGGSSDILQLPILPIGGYENEHHGVVVDAAIGTRTSNTGQSGLGAPRISYGSTNSKVGEAAFRDKHLQGGPSFLPQGFIEFNRPERVQASRDRVSNIVRLENNLSPESYNYLYQTDNGISAAEKAVAIDGVKAEGGYSYTGDDGQVYTVTYTADEDGFQPKGAHLPTPPPIPAEIQKSLEQNAKDEAAGLFDDGSYDAQKYNTAGDYSDSGDNDRYNDRQSNKVANRPGSNSPSSSFINQNNQAFKPNFSNQAGAFNNKEPGRINFENVSETAFATQANTGNVNKPDITQANFITSNRFGESNPSQLNQQTSQQFSQQIFGQTPNMSNDVKPTSSQDIGIPLSQQPLQDDDNKQAALSPTQSSSSVSTINNFENIIEPFEETKPSDASTSQGTIIPTNQPSRELTTPFETIVQSNVGTDRKPVNTFSSPVFDSATDKFLTSPQASNPQNGQQSQLTNKFEDNIYNYNKPPLSPIDSAFQMPSFQGSDDKLINKTPMGHQNTLTQTPFTSSEGEIYQYNKPIMTQGSLNIQGQKPSIENSNIKQQIPAIPSTSTNQPGSTYESDIYEYNRSTNTDPMQPRPTTSSIINVSQQQQTFEKQFVNQPTNDFENQSNKPSQPFIFNQQTSQKQQSSTSINSGEIYQYNKPPSSLSSSSAQTPTQNSFIQSQLGNVISPNSKQPSPQSSIPPTQPSFGFPSRSQQNYNTQTADSFREQTTAENLNSRPSQSTFVQPQPTIPLFSQTTINQFRQPQGPNGAYNYDMPSIPFQQANPSSDLNSPQTQSFGIINKPTSQSILTSTTSQLPSSFQNNGITQASISSFAPNSASPFNQPTNSPFNSRPNSAFAQASASTGPFPTFPSLTSQEPIQQTQQSNTYDGEIYEYNKPEESFPAMPETGNEKIIESPQINGQLNPQSISLDNRGSFKPVSSPQPLLPNTPQLPSFERFKPDQNKFEVSKEDSRPVGSTILGSPCCGNFQQNKQFKPETNRNELNAQSLTQQEPSSIKGEQFDANRKPSTFDSTGYHY